MTMNWLDQLLAEPMGSWPGKVPADTMLPWDVVLESLCAGLPPGDVYVLREERAGILEFEGGMTRVEADQKAGVTQVAWGEVA